MTRRTVRCTRSRWSGKARAAVPFANPSSNRPGPSPPTAATSGRPGAGDRAVVVLTGGSAQTSSAVSLVLLADGDSLPLGNADQAAGDPQSLGTFVTLSAPIQPNVRGWRGGRADAGVELRDPGSWRL